MNRIRELRQKNGITMKQLGKILGCSESAVSTYESGRHEPDITALIAMADYFNVTVDFIIGRVSDECSDVVLARNEINLLKAFRKLSVGEQRAIFRFVGIDYDDNGNSKIPQTREG